MKNLKKLIALALSLVTVLALFAGCGGGEKVVVYNWGDYIDPEVIDMFEEETGIRVVYELFETNESMYTKLKNSNNNYDVIIPSDYMIERLIKEGELEEINFANVPNFGTNIDAEYKNPAFDPENKYSVPYTWGTLGILYNTKNVKEAPTSWGVFWNPEYKGRIIMMNSQRDAIGMALKYIGKSLNETDRATLDAAKNKLCEMLPLASGWYIDEVKDKMIAGEGDLALVYAGDAVYCIDQNPDLAYVIPQEGSNIFYDSMCIPKGAGNKDNAEKFIDFMCRPEIQARNAEYIGYSSPSTPARELMGDAGKDPTAYPDITKYDLEFFSALDDETKEYYNKLWTEIKASIE